MFVKVPKLLWGTQKILKSRSKTKQRHLKMLRIFACYHVTNYKLSYISWAPTKPRLPKEYLEEAQFNMLPQWPNQLLDNPMSTFSNKDIGRYGDISEVN